LDWTSSCYLKQAPEKCNVLKTDHAKKTKIQNLANKEDGSTDSHCAVAILKQVFDDPFEEYVPVLFNNYSQLIHQEELGNQIQQFSSVSIFPNPTKNKLNIAVANLEVSVSALFLYNLSGQLVQTFEQVNGASEIDINLPKGSYIVQVNLSDGIIYNEFLVIE
jgi:hypothetical protein